MTNPRFYEFRSNFFDISFQNILLFQIKAVDSTKLSIIFFCSKLQKSLEVARAEIANLHNERDSYEETMKKAFMRGVCALNMEAMNMFKGKANDDTEDTITEKELHSKEVKS